MRIMDLPEGEIVAPLESYGVCAGCENARLGGTKPFVRRGDLLYCPPCDPLPRRHFCQVCKIEIDQGTLCEFHWEERYAASFEEKPGTGIPGGFLKKDAPLRATRSDDPHEDAKHHARIASGL